MQKVHLNCQKWRSSFINGPLIFFLKSMFLLNFPIWWYSNIFNLLNILMIFIRCYYLVSFFSIKYWYYILKKCETNYVKQIWPEINLLLPQFQAIMAILLGLFIMLWHKYVLTPSSPWSGYMIYELSYVQNILWSSFHLRIHRIFQDWNRMLQKWRYLVFRQRYPGPSLSHWWRPKIQTVEIRCAVL